MRLPDRLREIDAELDAFGVAEERLQAIAARARDARGSIEEIEEIDEVLATIAERFDTRAPEGVPAGVKARVRSWEHERAARESQRAPARAEPAEARGALEALEELDEAQLPAVLSSPPPAAPSQVEGSGLTAASLFDDLHDEEGSASLTDPSTTSEALTLDDPPLADDAPSDTLLLSRDALAGLEAPRGASQAPARGQTPSMLALELEGDDDDAPGGGFSGKERETAPAMRPPSVEAARASEGPAREPVHGSILPPGQDLDSEIADILADELEHPASVAPAEAEVDDEPTAFFSADMFGAPADEPSVDALVAELPGAPLIDFDDGAEVDDDVEIDLDDALLLDDADELEGLPVDAAPLASQLPPPLPSHAPPSSSPRSSSTPPRPSKPPGFLGRLLNRKG